MTARHRQRDSPGRLLPAASCCPYRSVNCSRRGQDTGHAASYLRAGASAFPLNPGCSLHPRGCWEEGRCPAGPKHRRGHEGSRAPDPHRWRERGRLPGHPTLTGRSHRPPLPLGPLRQAPWTAGSMGRWPYKWSHALCRVLWRLVLRPPSGGRWRLGQGAGGARTCRKEPRTPRSCRQPRGPRGGRARAASARHSGETGF